MTTGWAFGGLTQTIAGTDGATGPMVAPTGSIALASGDDHVRQSILTLLATRPGERVMRPDYGCPIDRLIFNPNDATTAGLAIHYVRQALLRFEPRIDILRLEAGSGRDAATGDGGTDTVLFIRLDYRVRSTRRTESLTFSIDLAGGAS
ncbi:MULTISPECIES: GPW/gp25 family protein [unclassified Ensifer]|uniref:GPW/gp25 family protein n=1 Tax=unclassified Ensifer TaxID=2633371 RepID=UPI0030103C1D